MSHGLKIIEKKYQTLVLIYKKNEIIEYDLKMFCYARNKAKYFKMQRNA